MFSNNYSPGNANTIIGYPTDIVVQKKLKREGGGARGGESLGFGQCDQIAESATFGGCWHLNSLFVYSNSIQNLIINLAIHLLLLIEQTS